VRAWYALNVFEVIARLAMYTADGDFVMTTVQVPDDVLEKAMIRAGTREPGEAVIEALKAYTYPHSQKDLIPLLGTCSDDSFLSPDELQKMRGED
jgi:hypothetical protein